MGYNIAVITGGAGSSRDASTASAGVVLEALAAAGHNAYSLESDPSLAQRLLDARPDAAFVCLSGDDAYTGSVQRLLEFLGVPFVGPSSSSCHAMRLWGPVSRLLADAENAGDTCAHVSGTVTLDRRCLDAYGAAAALPLVERVLPDGYPLSVRPDDSASAWSAEQVSSTEELRDLLFGRPQAASFAIEECREGLPISVCILGDPDDLQVLPPVEFAVSPASDGVPCLDGPAGTVCFAPVRLSSLDDDPSEAQAIRSEVERGALDAFFLCGCRDAARVDLLWDGARARILGIDVAPSFAPGSVMALACDASGIARPEIFGALVESAVER